MLAATEVVMLITASAMAYKLLASARDKICQIVFMSANRKQILRLNLHH